MSVTADPSCRPGRLRKLPARSQVIVMPMILSLLMSGVVSAISTLRAVGLVEDIHWRILQAWGVSYVVAFPVALFVLPVVRRIVALLVEAPESGIQILKRDEPI